MKTREKQTRKTNTLLVALMLLSVLPMSADAHRRAPLKALDTNADQAISLNEAMDARRKRFALIDSNDDGLISKAELAPVTREARLEDRFARVDGNKDGRISPAEWEAKVSELFARVDSNGDRLITREELRAMVGHWRRSAS